jgi:formyl-CoA transferase
MTNAAPELPDYKAQPDKPAGALHGIRVIDFTHFIAGPMCTEILADLGADVIKIENATTGDSMRAFNPRFGNESAPFLWANRNKQGIALNLASEAGRAIARDLIARADVLVENFSTGVMQRFGFDHASLAADHPRLIYCSVSAYGREGPLAERSGFDPVVQAEAGFMALNGDGEPMRAGPSIMDMSTGMMAANGVLAAIAARHRTGKGQNVEVALFDVATTMLGFHAMNYLTSGVAPRRFGNDSRDTAPTGVFHASDGPLYIACANDSTWRKLAIDTLDRRDLADMPEFLTNPDRTKNRDALYAILNAIFIVNTRKHWLALMLANGVPGGEVRELREAFASPEMRARGLATRIPHPKLGTVPNIASPLRLSATPVIDPVAAPTLGQHTASVLRGLGYDADRIKQLVADGAFGKLVPDGF